jgi:hypothetical protein
MTLTHFPKTRLSQVIGRLGGVSRSDAVDEAKKQLESMREKSDEVIRASLTALEAIIFHPETKQGYSPAQMREILCLGDQIVTLAGTFDYVALDKATRSLCDVTDGLKRTKRNDIASIHVHLRAMQMLAPGMAALPSEHVDMLLSELAKIMNHHGFDRLSDSADRVAFEEASTAPAG